MDADLRRLHRRFEPLSSDPVDLDREDQELRRDHQIEDPFLARRELHAQSVELAFGDWYRICSCGWISLGSVSERLAAAHSCPVEVADAERYGNRLKFLARMTRG